MDKNKNEVEIKMDEATMSKISESLLKSIQPEISKNVKEILEKNNEDIQNEIDKKFEASEKIIKKDINKAGSNINTNLKSSIENETKELRLLKSVAAMNGGDRETLRAYNRQSVDMRAKAGYNNAGVATDGGNIVLDPEFEAEIESLADVYGVALAEADVRRINSDSIKTNKRGSNVTMYEVNAEGGSKQGTKLTVTQQEVSLREFAAIAVATNRLIEDQAIDFWQEVTQGFAEEYARLTDQLVLTDSNPSYPGILYTDGISVETVGASISSLTWDDMINAQFKIPTRAQANTKYLMHRTVYSLLLQDKDDQGKYQFMPTGSLTTPWGTPIVLTDSLPDSSVVGDSNEGFIVVGDMRRTKLYIKRGLVLETSSQATVDDADGNSQNLWQNNMQALKAEFRAVNLTKFPEAFSVIGTGTVS